MMIIVIIIRTSLVLVLLLLTLSCDARELGYYVSSSPTGTGTSSGSLSQPFDTIQHAVNVVPNGSTIYLLSSGGGGLFTGGDLCVQSLITSLEAGMAASYWRMSSSSAEIQSTLTHVGTYALLLQRPTNNEDRSPSLATHVSVQINGQYQHRVRFWARVVPHNGGISTDNVCGMVTVSYYEPAFNANSVVSTQPSYRYNLTVPCRIDFRWQYKEGWIPSRGVHGNATVAVQLLDTSGNYSLAVDDISFVPFPSEGVNNTFWSVNDVVSCDERLPKSGIVGHVNGARKDDQYCEMYLSSGGWELFAMDGDGNKADHRLKLQQDNTDGNGYDAILSGTVAPLPSSMIYKKRDEYFKSGKGKELSEILIVIRNQNTGAKRWITMKPSVGGLVPPTTLFNNLPTAPGGGNWVIENDRGAVESSWNDCRSVFNRGSSGDAAPYVGNNVLQCRLFWKHMSSYTKHKSGWSCVNTRVFRTFGIDSAEKCYEKCLATANCHYFTHKAGSDQFCVGCSDPTWVSAGGITTTYSVSTPFDPPLVGLSSGKNSGKDGNPWKVIAPNSDPLPIGTKSDFDILVEGSGTISLGFHCSNIRIDFTNIKTPKWLSPPSIVSSTSCPPTTKDLRIKFIDTANIKLYRVRSYLNGSFFNEPTLDSMQEQWENSTLYVNYV
jgi:hypothetical protein